LQERSIVFLHDSKIQPAFTSFRADYGLSLSMVKLGRYRRAFRIKTLSKPMRHSWYAPHAHGEVKIAILHSFVSDTSRNQS